MIFCKCLHLEILTERPIYSTARYLLPLFHLTASFRNNNTVQRDIFAGFLFSRFCGLYTIVYGVANIKTAIIYSNRNLFCQFNYRFTGYSNVSSSSAVIVGSLKVTISFIHGLQVCILTWILYFCKISLFVFVYCPAQLFFCFVCKRVNCIYEKMFNKNIFDKKYFAHRLGSIH